MSAPVIHYLQNHSIPARGAPLQRRNRDSASRWSSAICVFAALFVKRSLGDTTLTPRRKGVFAANGSGLLSRFFVVALR